MNRFCRTAGVSSFALLLLCLSLASAVPQLFARKKDKLADSPANEQKRAVHALNRLTFGPSPGDVQQVMAMGVDRWIDMQLHPEKIDEWKRADKKKRISHFGAGVIRNALDKRDGYTSGERKRIYDLISELASHASYQGISLTTTGPDNMAQVGPFFDDKKLASWLGEMAMRLSHAAMVLMPNPSGSDMKLLAACVHYLKVVNTWWSKYRGMKPQATP